MTEAQKTAIGLRLRQAREQAGLSQGQAAKILGMHRPTISEMEAGRRSIASHELVAMCEIYDVDPNWILSQMADSEILKRKSIKIAARELAKLKQEDLERVLSLLTSLNESAPSDANEK